MSRHRAAPLYYERPSQAWRAEAPVFRCTRRRRSSAQIELRGKATLKAAVAVTVKRYLVLTAVDSSQQTVVAIVLSHLGLTNHALVSG